ncbi:MAG: hypothetical protein QM703_24265 [Gemmatales bacterium]
MMLLEGVVRNGKIELDPPQTLPEGARVDVHMKAESPPASSVGEMLLRHAGKAVGLPKDMAAQHDHYLHGTPKK